MAQGHLCWATLIEFSSSKTIKDALLFAHGTDKCFIKEIEELITGSDLISVLLKAPWFRFDKTKDNRKYSSKN